MTPPRPIIRACTLADIPAVHALLTETWHATYDGWLGVERVNEIAATWHSHAQLAVQVGRSDSAFLLGEIDGGLCGTAFAHDTSGNIEIGRLYVLPRHQRHRLGTALLQAIFAAFPGAPSFRLDVEPRNGPALAFYRCHGFAIIGAGTDCGGTGSGISHLRLERARPLPSSPAGTVSSTT